MFFHRIPLLYLAAQKHQTSGRGILGYRQESEETRATLCVSWSRVNRCSLRIAQADHNVSLRSTFCNSHFLFDICIAMCTHIVTRSSAIASTTSTRRSASPDVFTLTAHIKTRSHRRDFAERNQFSSKHVENYELSFQFNSVTQ